VMGLYLGTASWMCVLVPLAASGAIFALGAAGLARRRLIEGIASVAALGDAALAAYLAAASTSLEGPMTFPVDLVSPILTLNGLFSFQLFLDRLSAVMTLFVSVISAAIVVYSVGYMREDKSYVRYYGLVMLFIGSMVGLVLSGNLVLLYLFWESVGLCSCLLIAHWCERPEAAKAGVKAFVVTRFGDFALLTAIAILYQNLGSLDYLSIAEGMGSLRPSLLNLILLLALGGAVGKSAQLPLHVWLPDAMEGPTPVSALIHAATMVKAGVYLVARFDTLAVQYGGVAIGVISRFLDAVLLVGSVTALIAATMALVAYDLKRVLAYSTISQLGYMFSAVGLTLYAGAQESLWSALYHLTSHAVFKALLFMAAGAVIHAVGTRDMRMMGGLTGRMPVTFLGFTLGSLSLAGIPPFNGFFSKDAVIGLALEAAQENPLPAALLLGGAAITPLYILRALYMTFLAPPNEATEHAHEAPITMTGPVTFLTFLTLLSPALYGATAGGAEGVRHALHFNLAHATVSLLTVGVGVSLAYATYWARTKSLIAVADTSAGRTIRKILERGYYFDDLYINLLVPVVRGLAQELLAGLDMVIDGLVRMAGVGAGRVADLLRRTHTGRLTHFFAASVLGLLLLLMASVMGFLMTLALGG